MTEKEAAVGEALAKAARSDKALSLISTQIDIIESKTFEIQRWIGDVRKLMEYIDKGVTDGPRPIEKQS